VRQVGLSSTRDVKLVGNVLILWVDMKLVLRSSWKGSKELSTY
jgi:hypothetical protein